MTAGLQVFNRDGWILIDSTKMCFGLVKSGYVTAETVFDASVPYRPYKQIAVDCPNAQQPMVFFGHQPANAIQRVGLRKVEWLGSTLRHYYACEIAYNESLKVPYYVFDLMRPQGNSGFETYDRNGVCTFTSNRFPMRVLQSVVPPPPRQMPSGNFEAYTGVGDFSGTWEYLGRAVRKYGCNVSFPRCGFRASQTQVSTIDNLIETIDVRPDGFVMMFTYTGVADYGAAPWGDFVYSRSAPTITMIDIENAPIPFG